MVGEGDIKLGPAGEFTLRVIRDIARETVGGAGEAVSVLGSGGGGAGMGVFLARALETRSSK